MRALVIGGGIGGLAAAAGLRLAGCDVTVFERAGVYREIGAGLGLGANAIVALRALGLGERILSLGERFGAFEICDSRGWPIGSADTGAIAARYGAFNVCVHRAELLAALADALPRDVVRLGSQFSRFSQDSEGVAAHFADGSSERGELLIGADGLHSAVRAQLLGNEKPTYAGYTCWRGIARYSGDAHPVGVLRETWGRGRRFGAVAVRPEQIYWYATLSTPEGGRDEPGRTRQALLKRFSRWHRPIAELICSTPDDAIVRHDLYDRPAAARWGEGRVTLLGDAAHPTTPNLGQGACQAIEDAAVLMQCMAGRSGPDGAADALRDYERRRMDRTARVVRESARLGQVGQIRSPLLCALRNLVMRATFGLSVRRIEQALRFELH